MKANETPADTGFTFPRAKGLQYLAFLEEMHLALEPEWYLEIGTQTGASLAKSRARSVSVDPQFVLRHDVWSGVPELHLFQQTSDEFFAAGHLQRLGGTFGLAFLDGMHLYEFLLRDLINAERHMTPGGHIVLHDCLPWSENMALRDRTEVKGRAWTGDVWKVVPILKTFRPDLKVEIFDAAPTGLVVVSNLDPQSKVLADRYDEIVAKFDQNGDLIGYLADLKINSTANSPWRRRIEDPEGPLHFAIKTNVPRPAVQTNWGDYHFAVGLQKALERQGHSATVRTRKHWNRVDKDNEIDLVIKGHTPHEPRPGHTTLQWLISSNVEDKADHSFVASAPLLSKMQSAKGERSTSLLPQAFDPERMPLPDPEEPRSGVLFVGIARRGKRPIVNFALQAGAELDVWGPGWEDTDAAPFVRGRNLDNSALGQYYAKAEVVLNDHTRVMRRQGLVSNRIFDALACGTPVISDPVAWLPDDMRPFVECVRDGAEFSAALARIRAETKKKRKARFEFAARMRSEHSFDARAAEIVRVLRAQAADAAER
ncbi:glycosyltransferase family protein [Loktanella sp. Alg231-35]|uniref:glycosyltransferase family protein n=1 Tax=Loktanella sp. Alg231-35 TaxID=1922220 RepID=UPI00131F40A8|nr:glycosyltransferase [Loktanella sp. Alg231-35]